MTSPEGTSTFQAPGFSLSTLLYFRRFVVGIGWKLVLVVFLIIIAARYNPLLAAFAATLAESMKDPHLLRVKLAELLIWFFVSLSASFLSMMLMFRMREQLAQRLRFALYEKIGTIPSQSVGEQSIGSLAYRSNEDVRRICDTFAPSSPQLLMAAMRLFWTLVLLASTTDWIWVVLALIMIPVVAIGVMFINIKIAIHSRQMQQASEEMMTGFVEGIAGYKDLVVAGQFESAAAQFNQKLSRLRSYAIAAFTWNGGAVMVPLLIGNLLVFTFFYRAGLHSLGTTQNAVALGRIVAGANLLVTLPVPVIDLTQLVAQVAMAVPSFAKMKQWLDTPDQADAAGSPALNSSTINFEDVTFSYGSDLPPTVVNASFTIEQGSFTAIVGQSGGGKTTLFHLLLRLLEPQGGRILLGGVPLRDLPLKTLRGEIGYIPQSPFIFDATLRDNLCIGLDRKLITDARIQEVIELAQMHEMIAKRQSVGGLDARTGSGGQGLSAGERQRVALARVLLRDAKIVICDEYTANIDNATAKLIHETLLKVFSNRTRVLITHQLHTIRGADRVLVLDKGRIVDQGSYRDMISRPGLFREMWEVQRIE